MHKLTIVLDKEGFALLKEHAESRKRTPEEDAPIVLVNRLRALADYAEKLAQKNAKFRVYLPRAINGDEREKLIKEVVKEGYGVAPKEKSAPKERKPKKRVKMEGQSVQKSTSPGKLQSVTLRNAIRGKPKEKKEHSSQRKIDLYDSPGVALNKAQMIHEANGRSVKDILKDNGRDPHGKLVKP